jgi:hypothetical protein
MTKTMLKIFLIAVFLVTAHHSLSEANDRARSQKLNTESATVVKSGSYELDVSYLYIDQIGTLSGAFNNSFGASKQDRGKMRYQHAMLAFTYGLMDKMDITARIGWADLRDRDYPYADKSGNGITDMDIDGKYIFYQDERGLSLGYVAGIGIPVGNHSHTGHLNVGKNYWTFNQQLVLTKHIDDQWTMNADVGYRLPFGAKRDAYSPEFGRRMEDTRGTLDGNVALGFTGIKLMQPVVEANYAHEWISSYSDSDRVAFTVGAIVPLEKHRLRIGIQRDFWGRNATKAYIVNAGLTLAF